MPRDLFSQLSFRQRSVHDGVVQQGSFVEACFSQHAILIFSPSTTFEVLTGDSQPEFIFFVLFRSGNRL
jgi:hypothetical protein